VSETTEPDGAAAPSSLEVGALVRLLRRPGYLKTADPMPMLRPGDLVDPGEQGQVLAVRPAGQLAVRFRRGAFLVDAELLQPI
jgi:hypothetical protein